jgi:HAD superfamily hydrolase (TIGR01549 family)
MIKAIVFDFDGVIAESVDIKTRAFAYLFRDYPQDIIDKVVQYHIENGGLSRYEKFKVYYRDYLKEELTEEKSKQLGEEFSKFVYEEVIKAPYVEGAYEFLTRNKDRYDFFIVSGTPQSEIQSIAKERSIDGLFVEILGSPIKKGEHTKNILKKYNYFKEEVVFIGDAINDYIGAEEAGVKFIGRIIEDEDNPFKDKNCVMIKKLTELNDVLERM